MADSNVLLDVTTRDPNWAGWSRRQLAIAAAEDELRVDDVVFAEISVGYRRAEQVEALLRSFQASPVRTPRLALFLAAKAFQRYRTVGGIRTGVLPDFFIGAHAFVADAQLITRDARRYRTYFPELRLITPNPN
jgi:hypothetical protein